MSAELRRDRSQQHEAGALRTDRGWLLYRFEAFADPVYPVDSERAERIRREWLEHRLAGAGHAGRPYTILAREAMNRHTILETWEIYYTVRVDR